MRVVVWTGENDTKTISVDANRFENGAKQYHFQLKTVYCGGLRFNYGNEVNLKLATCKCRFQY